MKEENRRTFLKLTGAGILAFFVLIWNKLTLSHIKNSGTKEIVFPLDNKEVTFLNDYIVVQQNETTTVLTSHCSHLGCKINKVEDGKLVCPCHGSVYNLQGKVINGPAYKELEIIPSEISADGKSIIIKG